jgi:hypothetical protein
VYYNLSYIYILYDYINIYFYLFFEKLRATGTFFDSLQNTHGNRREVSFPSLGVHAGYWGARGAHFPSLALGSEWPCRWLKKEKGKNQAKSPPIA